MNPIDCNSSISRRDMIKLVSAGCCAGILLPGCAALNKQKRAMNGPLFRISLAQWSLHKLLFANEITTNDFARESREMGFEGIEYVNSFFKDKADSSAYLEGLNSRAADHGVTQLLIMVDGEGALGDADSVKRSDAIKNHHKWVRAAKKLGCHSIRVNAASSGEFEEQQKLAADGLRRLTEFAEPFGINVIVENHGGLSSNGQWLAGVMEQVNHPMCGTLPDFGNFCMDWSRSDDPDAWYDRYKGTAELMPYAKAVSAKSNDFDDQGNETNTDYKRMLKIVMDAGYRAWIGVEYEGSNLSPREGCIQTRDLLLRIRSEISTAETT